VAAGVTTPPYNDEEVGPVRPEDMQTFEETRSRAYDLLGDVRDLLGAEVAPGTVPSGLAAAALAEALRHIDAAEDALDRAGLG
jgi:hypothetical protein